MQRKLYFAFTQRENVQSILKSIAKKCIIERRKKLTQVDDRVKIRTYNGQTNNSKQCTNDSGTLQSLGKYLLITFNSKLHRRKYQLKTCSMLLNSIQHYCNKYFIRVISLIISWHQIAELPVHQDFARCPSGSVCLHVCIHTCEHV